MAHTLPKPPRRTLPITALLAGLVVLAAATIFALADSSRAHAYPKPSACPYDMYFIGARGSGESKTDTGGLGARVGHLYESIKSQLNKRKDIKVANAQPILDYPANSVFAIPTNLVGYVKGISAGEANAVGAIKALDAQFSKDPNCIGTRIVLAGYSQGAMVMHRAINDLYNSGDNSALARIAGAVLIGDGDRVPFDTTINYGGALPGATGIGLRSLGIAGSVKTKFAPAIGAKVFSVCAPGDAVCDSQSALAGLGGLLIPPFLGAVLGRFALGAGIHLGVYNVTDFGADTAIVKRIIGNLDAAPTTSVTAPTPSSTTKVPTTTTTTPVPTTTATPPSTGTPPSQYPDSATLRAKCQAVVDSRISQGKATSAFCAPLVAGMNSSSPMAFAFSNLTGVFRPPNVKDPNSIHAGPIYFTEDSGPNLQKIGLQPYPYTNSLISSACPCLQVYDMQTNVTNVPGEYDVTGVYIFNGDGIDQYALVPTVFLVVPPTDPASPAVTTTPTTG